MNILVVVAHPDDEVLGCGGTIARYSDKGAKVNTLILTHGRGENIISNANEAANFLGIIPPTMLEFPDQELETVPVGKIALSIGQAITRWEPDVIYTHSGADLNSDHRRTLEAVLIASRPGGSGNPFVDEVYSCASAGEWSYGRFGTFSPNVFVNIKNTLHQKLRALECYESEVRNFPHPRSGRALTSIAQAWGTCAGLEYAEAFELVRKIY
jgi:LmbE family N-acetylglucosaminyl deacetylase